MATTARTRRNTSGEPVQMVTEREVGTILAEIRHLAERQRDHAETTLRMFNENSAENGRRFDKVDDQIKTSSEKIEVLNNSIQQQKVINKFGIAGTGVLISAIGGTILYVLGLFPTLLHWASGKP